MVGGGAGEMEKGAGGRREFVKRKSSSGTSLAKMVEEEHKHLELRRIQTRILSRKDRKFLDGRM